MIFVWQWCWFNQICWGLFAVPKRCFFICTSTSFEDWFLLPRVYPSPVCSAMLLSFWIYFPVEPSVCLFVYNLTCTIGVLLQDAFQGALETFIIIGGCPVDYIPPTVWNSLPANLRDSPSLQTFKAKLKTHLFHAKLSDWFVHSYFYLSFWLHTSDCLELAAGRPERFTLPPNFQS